MKKHLLLIATAIAISVATAKANGSELIKRLSAEVGQLSTAQIAGETMQLVANSGTTGNVTERKNGATSGSKFITDRVEAFTTDIWSISFRGGERAIVYVSGDGDTDLDLFVYDSNGYLVGRDDDYTDECVVEWTPKWTGTFKVRVQNRGDVYNRYSLQTN